MKKLSLVIPCYNESDNINTLEKELRRFIQAAAALEYEFIFVNDGSIDSTRIQLDQLKRDLQDYYPDAPLEIKVIHLEDNIGKGGALKAGVLASSGKWILTLDADMATKATQVLDWEAAKFVDLRSPSSACDTVYIGSREHPESVISEKLHRRLLGRCFNLFAQLIGNIYTKDSQCGFKLYPCRLAKNCFQSLKDFGWAHDVEILMRLLRKGYSFIALPVQWKAVYPSRVNPLKDSFRIFSALFRMRLSLYFFEDLKFFKKRPFIQNSTKGTDLFYERLSFAFFIVLTALVFLTFQNYGISWDEEFQNTYGTKVLKYYTSLFNNREVFHYNNLYLYGGLFDGMVALVNRFSPLGEYETRHLINAFVGLFGILGSFKLGRYLGGIRAGFWSAVLLAITGSYWGHMFFNPKDIPFAVGFVWSVYYMAQWIRYLPMVPMGLIVKLGLAIGFTLGIRVGGLLLLAYLVLIVWVYFLYKLYLKLSKGPTEVKHGAWHLIQATLQCGILSYAIMLICWPWAQLNPFLHPFIALEEFTRHKWIGTMLFDGRFIWSNNLPWHYTIQYLLIKLPEIVVLFFFLSLFFCTIFVVTKNKHDNRGLTLGTWALLVFTIVFPISYVIYRKSVLYDAIRHLLFVIPLIGCVGGITISLVYDRITKTRKITAALFSTSLIVYIISHVGLTTQLHPYEYVYFNKFVGGLTGAYGKYETDYWGTSMKASVENLVSYLKETEKEGFQDKIYFINTRPHTLSSTYYFPKNFRYTDDTGIADFLINITRWNYGKSISAGTVVFVVQRLGVPLCIVKDLRKSN